jgi:hypothetical protein
MARRRYRSAAISNAGRAGKPPDAATEVNQPMQPKAEQSPQGASDTQRETPHPESFHTGLRGQIDAQRQYASDPLNGYLDAYFPGASPQERQWLKANPRYLQNPTLTHHAAMIALQRGIPRHSGEFLQFIGQLLDQHPAAMQAPPPPPMHAPAPPPPMPPPNSHHVDIEHIESHEAEPEDSEPEESHMAHHYAAPVSRGAGSAIEPELTSPSQVKLSAEQRDMARRSMPHLSHDEAEKTYAANLLKMEKAKKARLIE